jgi:hypothetical protein
VPRVLRHKRYKRESDAIWATRFRLQELDDVTKASGRYARFTAGLAVRVQSPWAEAPSPPATIAAANCRFAPRGSIRRCAARLRSRVHRRIGCTRRSGSWRRSWIAAPHSGSCLAFCACLSSASARARRSARLSPDSWTVLSLQRLQDAFAGRLSRAPLSSFPASYRARRTNHPGSNTPPGAPGGDVLPRLAAVV